MLTRQTPNFPQLRTFSGPILQEIILTETKMGHEQMRTEKRWMKWVLKEAAKVAAAEAKSKK
ncbi:MAG: hypothetical protein GY952_00820 [Rhodobacteraceae bacterium]|nr:hypothetical protein [Paracoccaceae bacterium]